MLSLIPHSFRNVIFDITPGDEAGRFFVNAKFLGVDMEKFQLHYQVRSLITAASARAKPMSAGLQALRRLRQEDQNFKAPRAGNGSARDTTY